MWFSVVCLWCCNVKEYSVVTLRCGDEGGLCVSIREGKDAIKRGLLPHYTHLHCLI